MPKYTNRLKHKSHYENVPFEVPEGWVWTSLNSVCTIFGRIGFRGYTKDDLVDSSGAITLSPSNIVDGVMNFEKCTYISWEKYEESPEIQVQNEDVLLVKTGSSYGKCAYVESLPKEATINPQFVVLKFIGCNPRFLTFCLQSNYARKQYEEFVLGTAIPTFTQVALGAMAIPMPPIEEQERIVAEVEKLLSFVDTLDEITNELGNAIMIAKSKILDLAIHGKLVPQDPNDEPASELLKRINPKAVASCDNPHYVEPYDLPDGWIWCKLMDLCTFLSRGKSPKYSETDTAYPVFAQKCNLKEGGISLENARFLEPTSIDRWPDVYHLQTGDVLVNSTGTGTVGRTRLFNESCLGSYPFVVPDSHVSVVRTHRDIVSEYIFALMSSSWIQAYLENNLAGSTNQKELYIGVLQNVDVPLPPIMEQKRIADKIETLYQQLDGIANHIE